MRVLPSSFRDPDGFLFLHDGCVYRQVNKIFKSSFEQFLESGLYEALVDKRYLLPHIDVTDSVIPRRSDCFKLILPQQLAFISYPYEWSFSQLKDAALLTLRIQMIALKYGFSLKDASAYNVQFQDGKPIFIDTLSFEPYIEGTPWSGYQQFCRHFLAPLALMSYVDIDLSKLLISHIDGIPLQLASKLLPLRTHFNYSMQVHLHLHAKMQKNILGRSLMI